MSLRPLSDRTPSDRPTCPFCAAPWTDAMLEHLDAMMSGSACSCCVDTRWPIAMPEPEPKPVPPGDLCCAACGGAIYRKV